MSAPAFASLAEAVRFLEERLDSGDAAGLRTACAGRLGCTDSAFAALKFSHDARRLSARYAGREFPDGDELKLGGHGAELGHVHVDFARRGLLKKAWRLEAVWVCR